MSIVTRMGETAVELPQAFRLLPNAQKAIVMDLHLQRAEANAKARVIVDQIFHEGQRRQNLAQRLAELRRDAAVFKGNAVADEDTAGITQKIAEVDADLKGCVASLESLQPRAAMLGATVANLEALMRGIEAYAKQHLQGEIRTGAQVPSARLGKDESFAVAIENLRRRIRELDANIQRDRARPKPSSVIIAREIERIDSLAKRGRPDAFAAIELGAPVTWPMDNYKKFLVGAGKIEIENPDTMAILAFLFRDEMVKAVTAAIEDAADDDNAVTDAERARLIAESERERLAVERQEIILVRTAIADGRPASFRPDTDPRALLDLADDMPAPSR